MGMTTESKFKAGDRDAVSPEDTKRLDELGFFWSDGSDAFISFRFGSA
jgi:hypothetical protein